MPGGIRELMKKPGREPDDVRTTDKTHVEILRLGGTTLARVALEPGWHWAEHVKPVLGTKSCEMEHIAYLLSGRLHVRMDTGEEDVFEPGDLATIAPGHDAWVEGDDPVLFLDLIGGDVYLKGIQEVERKAA